MTGAASSSRHGPVRSRLLLLAAYLVAGAAALVTALVVGEAHPLAVVAAADLVATGVVFGFSWALDNSSCYDPYWSVAPPLIALYLVFGAAAADASGLRQAVVFALVLLWGVRLTANFLRGWSGLDHEDWRYLDMRAASGRSYWLVSLLGIHLFPTVAVFLGCLSLFPALAAGTRAFGALDVLAALVTAGAIALEHLADEELRRFRRSAGPGEILATGLWARSRHPNYLGEMGFWWGLFLFGLAADPGWWWTLIGPLGITVMFFLASIPRIDKRMCARRPRYAEHMKRVPALLPSLRAC